jgi:tetratricopeptide (TPR) repeat protein
MDPSNLITQLQEAAGEKERRAILQREGGLGTGFFQELKRCVGELTRRDNHEALRLARIGLDASAFAVEQEGVAIAWWARGNALLFAGQYEDCLAAYSTAIGIFAAQNMAHEVAQLQSNCMRPLMWTGRHAEAEAMGRSALETLAYHRETTQMANLLLNLGICALHQGNHATALQQMERAEGIFERLGNVVEAARCRVTQSIALEGLDRFTQAESLLLGALEDFEHHEAWVAWARAALNLGVLHTRLADYQAALRRLEESRSAFLRAGIEVDAAVVDLYRAQVFVDVNLLTEAIALGKQLIETFTGLKMSRQVARAASLLAEAYTRDGQDEAARRELERARHIFHVQGDGVEVALLDLRRAALLRRAGRPVEALRLASHAAETLDVRSHPLRHAEAHLLIAACCEDVGQIEEAQVAYRVAWAAGSHPTGTTTPPPMLAYRIAHARGAIAEAAGERALACGEYDRAVAHLGHVARGLGLEELRGGYLADKRPVYEGALRLALEDGRIGDAFRISELARAGALRDFLGNARHRSAAFSSSEEVRLEELRARWAWRVSGLQRPVDLLAEADEDVVGAEDRVERLRELARLEQEIGELYRRRRLHDPRFTVLEQGEVLGLEAVQRALDPDTALLAFDHEGGRLLAFVVTHRRAEAVPLCTLDELRWDAAGLGHALEEVRLFDDPADLALLERDLLVDLQAVYGKVMQPLVERLGTGVGRLLVVGCDVLHTLPLEAFHDGRRYLLERYSFCYLPSASLIAVLPEERKATAGPPLVMAHSWEGRLPLAEVEAEGVAHTLRRSCDDAPILLTGPAATSEGLAEWAGLAGLVHLAVHSAFRADAPLFSALHLAGGPLTVNEVYGLDLSRPALLTLSACQTALGQGRGGEVLGLTHACFFAGAASLVVSRWRVEDETTARLMQDFYAALVRGEPVADALRTAQLATLAVRPHAGYWAAFAAWGRGFHPIF